MGSNAETITVSEVAPDVRANISRAPSDPSSRITPVSASSVARVTIPVCSDCAAPPNVNDWSSP